MDKYFHIRMLVVFVNFYLKFSNSFISKTIMCVIFKKGFEANRGVANDRVYRGWEDSNLLPSGGGHIVDLPDHSQS